MPGKILQAQTSHFVHLIRPRSKTFTRQNVDDQPLSRPSKSTAEEKLRTGVVFLLPPELFPTSAFSDILRPSLPPFP